MSEAPGAPATPAPNTEQLLVEMSDVMARAQALLPNLPQVLQELEYGLILVALKSTGQNCAAAAKILGLNRTTLVEKRRTYGMVTPRSVA